MRRYGRIVSTLVVILVLVLGVGPLLTGLCFKKKYLAWIDQANAYPGIKIQLIDFKREWFYSHATLSIEISESNTKEVFTILGLPEKKIFPFQVTVWQTIQHGPIIFQHVTLLPYVMGWAASSNKFLLSPKTHALINSYGSSMAKRIESYDLITFGNSYSNHFNIEQLQLHFANNISLAIGAINGDVLFKKSKPFVESNVDIQDAKLYRKENYILLPNLSIQAAHHKNSQGMWVGKDSLNLASIMWNWKNTPSIFVTDVKLASDTQDNKNALSGYRKLSFKTVSIDNEEMGPFSLELSLDKFNTQRIMDIFSTYREVRERGEYYQSELKNKMAALLPHIVKPGSIIKLDKLYFATKDGEISVTGDINWPAKNFVQHENIMDTLDASAMQTTIQISKKLTWRALSLLADIRYLQMDVPNRPTTEMSRLDNETTTALQQNSILLAHLVEEKQIPEQLAAELIEIQKMDATGEMYLSRIKELYLSKTISQQTAYFIYFIYANVWQHVVNLVHTLENPGKQTLFYWQDAVNEWVQKGFITIKQDDYYSAITRNQGILKINGKAVKT